MTIWMRRMMLCAMLACAVLMMNASRIGAQPREVVVSSAASLKGAMKIIAKDYEDARRGVKVKFNFGSSGALQKQIEQGAPVDVFISAADKNMNELAAKNRIDVPSRGVLASNRLVLIVPRDSKLAIHSFKDVASQSVRHVAVGGPSVPAGLRAQEVFTKLGIWPSVQAKAVRGKDVREVLTQVELGNVEAGVVYRTDALSSNRVRIVATAPISFHKPIRYPFAVLSDSRNKTTARDFTNYLQSAKAKAVLKKLKFIVR